jgi:hypothetical protein
VNDAKPDPQTLLLDLFRLSDYCDANAVVDSLLAHRDWWRSVLPGRIRPGLTLRDLAVGEYGCDGIWIWSQGDGRDEDLMRLAKSWDGAMPNWLDPRDHEFGWSPDAERQPGRVMRVWWD